MANIFSPHYSLTSHSPSGIFEWMEVLGLNVHSPVSQSFPFWLLLYVSSSRNLYPKIVKTFTYTVKVLAILFRAVIKIGS